MKKIFTMLSFKKFTSEIKKVFIRFPVGFLTLIYIATLFFILGHVEMSQVREEIFFRGIFSGVILFFFSVALYVFSESQNHSQIKKQLLQGIPIFYASLFFAFFKNNGFNDMQEFIFFFLSLLGIIGYLYFAPYCKNILKNNGKQSVYYTYFYNLSVIFLLSCIIGWILFALGAIGITTVETLFDIGGYLNSDAYIDWGIISLVLFAPIFGLSLFPNKQSFNNNYFNENSFFSFIIKYVAIPFIYVYFFILYAYSAKVLINFGDWPKGEVSWMVILFSIFGYITYVFSYIFEEKANYIRLFRKYFPWVVIPQIFMLFYAIHLRIAQYDITVNRYFVVIFGIWLLSISIYYTLSKKKYLGNIFTTLTISTIIISIGPWSVYSLPEARQYERLVQNLKKADILQEDGKIVPLKEYNQIDADLSKNIYSGIDYLCDFNNCNKIKKLFPEIYKKTYENFIEQQNIEKKNNPDYKYFRQEPRAWEIVQNIRETIKVDMYGRTNDQSKEPYYYVNLNHKVYPLDTRGVQTVYKINSYSNSEYEMKVEYNDENGGVAIYYQDEQITEFNYDQFSKNIFDVIQEKNTTNLDKDELTFDISNQYGNFSIIFDSITIKNTNIGDNSHDDRFHFSATLLQK